MSKTGKNAAARNALARTAAETTALSTAAGGMVLASLYARDAMAHDAEMSEGEQRADWAVRSAALDDAADASSPARPSDGNAAAALAAVPDDTAPEISEPEGGARADTPEVPEGARSLEMDAQSAASGNAAPATPVTAAPVAEEVATVEAALPTPAIAPQEAPATEVAGPSLDEIGLAGFANGVQSSVGSIVDQALAVVPNTAELLAHVPSAGGILGEIRPGIEETITNVMSAVPTTEGIAALASLPVEVLGGTINDEIDFWGEEAVGDLAAPVEAIEAGAANMTSWAGDGALSLGFLGQSYQDEATANDPGGLALSPGLSGLI